MIYLTSAGFIQNRPSEHNILLPCFGQFSHSGRISTYEIYQNSFSTKNNYGHLYGFKKEPGLFWAFRDLIIDGMTIPSAGMEKVTFSDITRFFGYGLSRKFSPETNQYILKNYLK